MGFIENTKFPCHHTHTLSLSDRTHTLSLSDRKTSETTTQRQVHSPPRKGFLFFRGERWVLLKIPRRDIDGVGEGK